MIRVFRAALLSLTAAGLALAAHAQTPAPAPAPAETPAPAQTPAPAAAPNPDTVVARVNGQEVKLGEVMRAVGQLPPQVQQMPLEMLFQPLLDQIISQKLVSVAAYKEKLDQSPEVKEELKRAEERAVQRAYIQQQIHARITPEALAEQYKQYLAENPAQEEAKASHILVEKEEEAKAILDELAKGGDFAKIAKEKSKDTVAAQQGGDLGYFTKDTMVEPFADAAFAMKPGEISKTPVKTQFGYHIIKVEDKRVQPQPSLDEVKGELEQQLSKEIVGGVIDDLKATASIETFRMDGTPAPKEEPKKDEAKKDAAPAKKDEPKKEEPKK